MGVVGKILNCVFGLFSLSQLPVIVLFTTQLIGIVPDGYYPDFLKEWLEGYYTTNKDPIVSEPPPWMLSFFWVEFLFHLPYHVLASISFLKGNGLVRLPALVYAANAFQQALTYICYINYTDFYYVKYGPHTDEERNFLIYYIYGPYAIVTFLMLVYASCPHGFTEKKQVQLEVNCADEKVASSDENGGADIAKDGKGDEQEKCDEAKKAD